MTFLLASCVLYAPQGAVRELPTWCYKLKLEGTRIEVEDASGASSRFKQPESVADPNSLVGDAELSEYPYVLGGTLPPSLIDRATRLKTKPNPGFMVRLSPKHFMTWELNKENKISSAAYWVTPVKTDSEKVFSDFRAALENKLGAPGLAQRFGNDKGETPKIVCGWMWRTLRICTLTYWPSSAKPNSREIIEVRVSDLDKPE